MFPLTNPLALLLWRLPTERSLEIKLVSYLNGPVPERAISANLQFKFQAMIAVTFLFTSLETRRELGRVNFC